jgi:2-oxoisovalerate dehydrogenase E1 component
MGLPKRFPGRVLNTPISEAGFTGLAGGAAMSGLRPVIEIMFPDFALVAADQIFNQIGKLRHMYGGKNVDMPVVMRTRIAAGCGYGGQHSMDPAALFALFSGWQVVAPSTPADYIGLFNSAMQSKDPVLIIEHHELYNQKGDVPDSLDYFIKIGNAKKVMEGSDVTVIAHSWSISLAKNAAKDLESERIHVDLIDLRTISMPDIDYDMIGESVMKTGNIVIIEQSPESNSIGARIGYECQRRFFDYLDGPIWTVTAIDVPTPVSRWAEAATMPAINDIKDVIRRSTRRQL